MSYETILTDTEDGILTITLNRPERLNAWTYTMAGELREAVEAANADDAIEAIVFTGAGRGFCAGADVEEVFKAQSENTLKTSKTANPGNWVTLVRESKPIIAAVNGAAIGLGVTQILPMDMIVASRAAKFSLRFVKMGLVPELASSYYLGLRVGYGQTNELMLTGKTIDAEEALRIGLVDRLVEQDELLPTARSLAKSMGENPQAALRMIKQLLTENTAESDIDRVQQREGEALKSCYVSPEHKEAISAFLEKRTPDFRGARKGGPSARG